MWVHSCPISIDNRHEVLEAIWKHLTHFSIFAELTQLPEGIRGALNNHQLIDTYPAEVVQEIKDIVESRMQEDDETTAVQLHEVLKERAYNIPLSTILRCRKNLGLNFRGSAYCQMIQDVNKEKLLACSLT